MESKVYRLMTEGRVRGVEKRRRREGGLLSPRNDMDKEERIVKTFDKRLPLYMLLR